MNSRTRFLITAAFVCHLLVAPALVTSQLLSSDAPPNAPSAVQGEEVTMRAQTQEKDGPIFKLRGQAEIHYRTYILYADEITYNSESGTLPRTGTACSTAAPTMNTSKPRTGSTISARRPGPSTTW